LGIQSQEKQREEKAQRMLAEGKTPPNKGKESSPVPGGSSSSSSSHSKKGPPKAPTPTPSAITFDDAKVRMKAEKSQVCCNTYTSSLF